MTALNKVLESKMKIRFHDCDPFNHLNNSRYIDYIMTARGDQLLDHYNFDIHVIAFEKGVAWVTAQTQISYLSPATLMEEVIIQTRLRSYTDKGLLFEAVMYSGDKSSIKAVMWCRLVHFNLQTKRSHVHAEEFMALFQQVADPLDQPVSFDEHVKILKQSVS